MGILFLILFTLAEITLAVLTLTKFTEKFKWLRNRAIVRAAELVILSAIVLVPATHMKWRFFAAAAVLAIRFIFDGVMWLIKRNKAAGLKKKAWSVVNCVMSVLLIALSLTPAFLFTNYNGLPADGEYKINEVSAILVDENRLDDFENDGTYREVPVHFYYPENAVGEFPLVVFSHGAFGYYQSNYSTYAELASNGYIVAALEHPHHSVFTKDTNGKIITVDPEFIDGVMKVNETASDEKIFALSRSWLELRTADEDFAINVIKAAKESGELGTEWNTAEENAVLNVLGITDTDKIGLIGHSLGGASSVALGRERGDIDAVIDLDGTMLGEIKGIENGKNVYFSEAYPVPVLDFTKEKDYNDREQYKSENVNPYVNEYVTGNAKEGKTVVFSDVGHLDFTDLPLISPALASMLGSGDVNHEETINTINRIVINWFDYYLKNEGTLDIQANY